MLCAKFAWNWPIGSWEENENMKNLQTDGRTDGSRTSGDQKSSLELSAQVSYKPKLWYLHNFLLGFTLLINDEISYVHVNVK